MLKKVFYFGLGVAEVLSEKFDELASVGEERLAQQNGNNQDVEVELTTVAEGEPLPEPPKAASVADKADDLTTINGIGPTFAKRLNDAGIKTYSDLAAQSADQLKEITKVAEWQADPNDWILQAKAAA